MKYKEQEAHVPCGVAVTPDQPVGFRIRETAACPFLLFIAAPSKPKAVESFRICIMIRIVHDRLLSNTYPIAFEYTSSVKVLAVSESLPPYRDWEACVSTGGLE